MDDWIQAFVKKLEDSYEGCRFKYVHDSVVIEGPEEELHEIAQKIHAEGRRLLGEKGEEVEPSKET